jgi:hypothetical protein
VLQVRISPFTRRDCNNISCYFIGRNGGHLTPYAFQHFRAKEAALGSEEAKKGILLEHYTVDALLKIIRENGLEDQVDLVSGGHLSLYETRLLERVARRDYFGSRDAGVNVSAIEWLNVDDVWMVWIFIHENG